MIDRLNNINIQVGDFFEITIRQILIEQNLILIDGLNWFNSRLETKPYLDVLAGNSRQKAGIEFRNGTAHLIQHFKK